MRSFSTRPTIISALALATTAACNAPPPEPAADPPEVVVGERLFLETRFAQFFAVNSGDDVNRPLVAGDPVLDTLETTGAARPGPFAGKSMSCRACHLVDESPDPGTTGIRTYADFAARSPIPDRGDGRTHTPRNSPPLVNASIARGGGFFLHFDGEFASAEDLVVGTFTGRNFGWLAPERADAVAHVARVIRGDDGRDALARGCSGLSYATILKGTAPEIPATCRLPEPLRIDVTSATDDQVLRGVAGVVAAYMRGLVYQRDDADRYVGSPYDRFLILNGLPRQPGGGESAIEYARRLRVALAALPAPKLLDDPNLPNLPNLPNRPDRPSFAHHDQPFAFGADALAGLRIFLTEPAGVAPDSAEIAAGGIGNCIACHAPPHFTDFGFHNNGSAQEEYDALHGAGAFAALAIPSFAERQASPDTFLPPSPLYPTGTGTFLAAPSPDAPGRTDLGVWNVLGNDAVPGPQAALAAALGSTSGVTDVAELLPLAIARFKTAGLRDLGQSAPYFHTGRAGALEDAARHYLTASAAARAGTVRNGDSELARIAMSSADIAPLSAFLRALNEDYD
jgi:cytochrome c peroxidase